MSWNTSLQLRNIQAEINQINYIIDNNVDGIGPQGPQGIQGIEGIQGPTGSTGATGSIGSTGSQGIQGVTGATGANGVSLFDITLNGGATYTAGSLSSFNTNSSTGYAVTTQAYNSGCMISSYATRANAIFIGLTETTNVTNPSTPYISFSHVLYSDNQAIYRIDDGVLNQGLFVQYPNSNPNFTFSVKYDNSNLYYYADGVELVNLRLNVGAGKTYYGCWASFNAKTFSNIQFVPLAEGIQGATGSTGATGSQGIKGDTGSQGIQGNQGTQGIQGIQGIQGVKGDPGSIITPVNNLVEFNAGIGMAGGANKFVIGDSGETLSLSLSSHVGSIHTNNPSANTDASILFNANNVSTSFLNQLTNVRTTPLSVDSSIVTITDTLNVSNQINCRAVVASYEVAIVPSGTGTTSNLILGSNNNNNYILYQNNSPSNPNELLLQYQNNSIQPSTTSTLMNVLPNGNIQIGDLGNASPNVSISGSGGLGRIYDTIYNPVPTPNSINVANFSANFTPSFLMDGNISNAFFSIDLSSFALPNLDNVEMTITAMSFTGTNTGASNAAAVLNFYLAPASDIVYQAYMGSSFGISCPATSAIPSPTSFNIQYSPIILTLNTIAGVKIQNLFLICNYICPVHPSAQITPTNFTISGLVKAYMSSGNEPLTVVPL